MLKQMCFQLKIIKALLFEWQMVDTAALVDVYLQNLEGRKKVKHRDQDAEITHEQPQGQKPSREARKGYKSHLWF